MDDYACNPVTAAGVDRARLAMLRELGVASGKPGMLGELFGVYARDCEGRLRELHAAVAVQAADRIEAVAHAVSGSSANLGFSTMHQLARELETLARRGTADGADAALAAIETEFARVQSAIAGDLAGSAA